MLSLFRVLRGKKKQRKGRRGTETGRGRRDIAEGRNRTTTESRSNWMEGKEGRIPQRWEEKGKGRERRRRGEDEEKTRDCRCAAFSQKSSSSTSNTFTFQSEFGERYTKGRSIFLKSEEE
jgi:hypothetical protein